jgi:hypothetical protein
MRASMRSHCVLLVQVYLQKPPRHVCGEPPWQSALVAQFGTGAVFTWQAPWLQ